MQTTAGASLSDDNTQYAGPRRRTGTLLAIAAAILTLDQLSKVWAVEALESGQAVQVLGELLQLRLVRNPGAAFSMFTDMTVVLTVIAITVVVVIGWVSRKVTSLAWAVALGGLLGGALGTLTDRIFRSPGPMRGHVVDFLELPNWPVFNVADSCIVGAAVLIGWLSLRGVAFSAAGNGADVARKSAADDGSSVHPGGDVPRGGDRPSDDEAASGNGADVGDDEHGTDGR